MAVNLATPNPAELLPVKGVRLGVTEAGIRKANRRSPLPRWPRRRRAIRSCW